MTRAEPSLRRELNEDLAAAGLQPSRKLGQNFMIDTAALAVLVEAADPGPGDRVLEVGPGTGILSKRLLARGAQVLAVELDRGMAALLQQRLVPAGLHLLQTDALATKNRLAPEIIEWAALGPWLLCANLPYDISIPLLLNCLALPRPPQRLAVTVQLEAAQRLCAVAGSAAWGASAAVAQAAGKPRILRRLPPGCFYPAPRVHSAILAMTPERALPPGFARFCRAIFAYRRKRLSRALRDLGLARDAAVGVAAELGCDPDRRVETLTVAELERLHAACVAVGPTTWE